MLAALVVSVSVVSVPAQAQQRSPETNAAASHLQRTSDAYGLTAADLADFQVTDAYVSRRSGTTHVYLRQQVNGIPVVGGEFTVALDRDGQVVHATGHGAGLARQQNLAATPAVSASAAAEALARDAGLTPAGAFSILSSEGGRVPNVTLSEAGIAQRPVTAKLVYHLDASGMLALAWETELEERAAPHYWLGYIDAESGQVLARYDLVVHDSFGPAPGSDSVSRSGGEGPPARFAAPGTPLIPEAEMATASPSMASSYTVYAAPLESPLWASPAPPSDARTTVADPEDPTASPFGWHDTDGVAGAEFTTTRGNNVHAYTDLNGDNEPDQGGSPDGGAGLVFDFPIDLTADPFDYRPAAVTNLFYWSNVVHDVMYQYGFDEPAGNFQVNNYGNGGIGGDDVQAEAQDASVSGGGNCNANFATPRDGVRPRMQMYTCDFASPDSDGDFDNGVIVHEYGHGISTRLTGGPAISSCLFNTEQMGEGWSDFYALLFTMDAADTRTTSRPIGNYLIGQSQSGGGIRGSGYQPAPGAPYNTNFAVNSATYGATATAGTAGGLTVPHGLGFVWATILWEMTWDLIDAYGYDPDIYNASGGAGNQLALELVTEGLKMQPCSPGFVDGRDAILAADAALYPDPANPGQGLHYATLWQAFARRGLGISATQGSSGSNSDNVEAFDTPLPPPALSVTPNSLSFALQTDDTATGQVVVSNTAALGSADLELSAVINNFSPLREETDDAARTSGGPRVQAVAAPFTPQSALSSSRTGPPTTELRVLREDGPALPVASDVQVEVGAESTARGGLDCTDGQLLDQPDANFFTGVASGQLEVGQSFVAPCTGFIRYVAPVINATNDGGVTWNATMRVYEGAGTLGTQLAAASFSFTNPASGAFFLTITLPSPVPVTQGQTYTWFMDMTSASTGIQYSSFDPYSGGVLYVTFDGDPANAGRSPGDDMQFRVRFDPPQRWVTYALDDPSVAPGSSTVIDVFVDTFGLPDGIYTADLVISSNDPGNPSVVVPITLEVDAAVELYAAVMLGGAYDLVNGVMRTDLADGGYLPVAHPFVARGYPGSEVADPGVITSSDPPVDWVLIHLRNTPGGENVASRAALLLSDGVIVDTDGFSPVAFVGESSGSYYVVVEPVNHLAVMSATPVDLSSGFASYDFTTALAQAYAGGASAAMRQAEPGVWALWPGDADGDGQVTAPDFNAWSAATAAASVGYDVADFDLDGQVTAPDFNAWSASTAAAAETSVPAAPSSPTSVTPVSTPIELRTRSIGGGRSQE